MFKRLLLSVWILLLGCAASYAQTTIIGPSTLNGGFEDATNTAWQFVNGTQTNYWVISTGATTGFSGTKSGYVTNSTSSPFAHTYTINSASIVHMYQDVTFPAGEPVVNLSFKYIAQGESCCDRLRVFISNGNTPTALGNTNPTGTTLTDYSLLTTTDQSGTWVTVNVPITAAQAGNTTVSTTRRILFVWRNDGSVGTNPPAGVDDVLLTSACSGPTGLNATAVTTTGATLNWTALTGATGYNVRYKKVSDPVTVPTWATPANTTATTLNITGLTANQVAYEFQVSATGPVCNNYNASATFITACALATLPYTETFESIAANNQLPSCMVASSVAPYVYTYTAATGSYNQANHTTGGSKFASFRYGSNDWLFTPLMSLTAGSTYKFSFWYVTDGLSGWDSLKVGMGTSQTAAGMAQQFTIATGANNTTYQLATQNFTPTVTGTYSFGIKVKATSGPWYLSVDDINVTELVSCTGTPLAEVISPSTGTACPANAFTLSSNNANNGAGGVTYQWQSAPSATGPWTNITGATNGSSYTQTGISATTYFRLQATCTASSQTSTSNTSTITVNSFINCYCASGATSASSYEDIGQFTLGATFANPTTAPTVFVNNPAATQSYTDFTSLGPIALAKGVATNFSVTQISASAFYSMYSKIYVDLNQNGSFTDPGEELYAGPSSPSAAAPTFSGTITIPNTAATGITRLRIVLVETSSATGVTPCGTYTWGETEDYLVSIPGTPNPPTVTNNGPVCGNGTAVLTATASVLNPVYTVTGPGIVTPITSTTGIITVPTPGNGATSATYSVTVTAYGFTSTATTTVVALNEAPTIAAGTLVNPTSCTGTNGSIQITGAANNATYTLRYRRNAVNATPLTITTTATGTYTITGLDVATFDSIRVTSSIGCVSNNVGPITLTPPLAPPSPTVTYNTPLCLGSTLTLTVTNGVTGATYNWTGANGFTATGTTVTRSNIAYADSGNYSVIVTSGGCPSAPTVTRVVITPPSPQPTVAAVSQCQNATGIPLTAVGTNLLFYTSLTGGTGSATLTPSTATIGTQTFYVTQASNGCESRPRVAISVVTKSTPPAPTLPNNGNISRCQFSTPTPLTATAVAGATLNFYTTPTGGVGTPTFTPPSGAAGVTNYYVSQTLNGCESPRAVYTVTTNLKPAPPVVSSPLNLCQFAVVGPLTANGQNINWYENATGGVPLLTPPVPQTNVATPRAGRPDRDTFFATQTVNGCESDRSFLEVVVNYQPNATFIPSKRFVCVDDTISFIYYGNADAAATYTWSVPKPAGIDVSGQGTQGPFVARFDSVGVYDINLIVSANGCTSTPVYQRIEVRDRPQTRINAKRQVCLDEVVEISIDSMSEAISNYNFTFDGGKVEYATYDAGPFGISWNTPGEKQIIVNTISRFCGSRVQAEIINVRPAPTAVIQNKPTGNICSGDSVRLQAIDLGPGYKYTWTPSNIFQDRANRGATVFTTPFYRKGKYFAVLTVTDSIGCEGQDNLEINTIPCCDVYFPNAFAPNSQNEKNNRFGMLSLGVPTRYTLRVMNRWGRVVFETSDARQGWDGRYEGEAQPMGTYVYYAKYRCASGEDFEQKGDVTLIR